MNGYYKFLEQLIPATVNIQTRVRHQHPSASTLGTERAGSGTIIDASGHILTVGYVVLGAETITVTQQQGQSLPADIVHIDFESGLAVLRANFPDAPTIPCGDSHTLVPGQTGLILSTTDLTERRVTEGLITAVERFDAYWEYMVDRAILTTAVNTGFGGGAFITLDGHMVGVVSLNLDGLKDATMVIPLEYFQRIKDDVFTHGGIRNYVPRAWLGLYPMPSPRGLVVFGILPKGPAAVAGIQQGDIIVGLDDEAVTDRPAFYERLWQHQAGEEVVLAIIRDDRRHIVPIVSQDRNVFYA